MTDYKGIELVLDGIREELNQIRILLQKEQNRKSMIMQKVSNENYNTKLL